MARSASVALWRGRFSIPRFIVGICINFLVVSCTHFSFPWPPFVHFLLCFYRKENITFLTSLTTIMINPLSNKKTLERCCYRMAIIWTAKITKLQLYRVFSRPM